jgi:hypothetical protein
MSIVIPTSAAGVTTVYDIIRQAMKDIGAIGGRETPSTDEAQDALSTLNQSYTIGADGDLDIERPYAVDAVYWLDNGVSRPLVPMHSFEDYQDIGVKDLSSTPSAFYYRPDFPLAQLFVWPAVNTGSLVLTMRVPMPIYADIYEEISLPAEYLGAIRWNLALMLCATFGLQPNASVVLFAKQTKRALKIINTQLKTMRMPDAVLPTTLYNIRTGV